MKILSLAILIFSLLLAGCGTLGDSARSGSHEASAPTESGSSSSANASRPAAPLRTTGGGGSQPLTEDVPLDESAAARQTAVPTDRKIIRNADLELESDSPEEAQAGISEIAERMGGFVVESQQSSSDLRSSKRDTVTMTIRVPAVRFGETLAEIRKASGRIIVETVKGQDVTEEFIDIEARLKAQEALEAQFTEIMKRANTVEEALNVQRQLAQVRSEIEKIEGRKRFLENQSSLSTIKLRIRTPAVISAGGPGFIARLTDSINTGLDAAIDFVLGLVTFVIAVLPFALFIGLPGYLLLRYFWRKARRKPTAAEIAEIEIKGD